MEFLGLTFDKIEVFISKLKFFSVYFALIFKEAWLETITYLFFITEWEENFDADYLMQKLRYSKI